jgi:hypothetical protein
MPISLDINEETVNILNDIASCFHNETVSSYNGDVISVAVKRELKKGHKIKVTRDGFYIQCIDYSKMLRQKNYLENKIKNIDIDDPNTLFIKRRIKNLSSKKLTISLTKDYENDKKIELDGFLKFIENAKSGVLYNKKAKIRNVYSLIGLNTMFKKLKSILILIASTECIIYQERKNE